MDMNEFMKKAQEAQKQLQEQLKETQKRLAKLEITGEAGAGIVKITIDGRRQVKKVEFDKAQVEELLADSNLEVLGDLIAGAANNANQKFEREQRKQIQDMASGIDMPKDMDLGGLFKDDDDKQ